MMACSGLLKFTEQQLHSVNTNGKGAISRCACVFIASSFSAAQDWDPDDYQVYGMPGATSAAVGQAPLSDMTMSLPAFAFSEAAADASAVAAAVAISSYTSQY